MAPLQLGLARNTMLTGVTLAALGGLFAIPLYGALSDRIGRRPVYLFGAAFSLLYALPFFLLLDTRSAVVVWTAIVVGVAVGHNAMYGPQAALLLGTVRRERPLQRRVASPISSRPSCRADSRRSSRPRCWRGKGRRRSPPT